MKSKDQKDASEDAEFAELIRRAQKGDRLAQERLFEHYRGRLVRQAARRVGPGGVGGMNASDVVQETLLKASDNLKDLEQPSRPALESWLSRILQNTIVQSVRGALRRKRDASRSVSLAPEDVNELAAPQESPSQTVARGQEWRRVLAALNKLPEGQREAVWMRHMEERSLQEIARRLQRTELAAASLIRRGLATLREELSQEAAAGAAEPADLAARVDQALAAYLKLPAGSARREALLAQQDPECQAALRRYLDAAEQLRTLTTA